MRLRNACYNSGWLSSTESPIPVICVGNATVGGNGKTPLTDLLAKGLLRLGYQPTILLRGYGGKWSGPHQVDGTDIPENVGEESLLHQQVLGSEIPVIISRDRPMGIAHILNNQLGNVVILDDGLQHRRLRADINLLLLDSSSEQSISRWSRGHLLPSGYLREPLDSAISRADAVVFVRKTYHSKETISQLPPVQLLPKTIPAYTFDLGPENFRDVYSGEKLSLEQFRGQKAIAISAIASPTSFHQILEALAIELAETRVFRDHYNFSRKDLSDLSSRNLPIITTAKDAIKLERFVTAPHQLYTLELEGRVTQLKGSQPIFELIQNVFARKIEVKSQTKQLTDKA